MPTKGAGQTTEETTDVTEPVRVAVASDGRRIIGELLPREIRWLYKKNIKDLLYTPLNDMDSLTIEDAYQRHLQLGQPKGNGDWSNLGIALDSRYVISYEEEKKKSSTASSSPEKENVGARFNYFLEPIYLTGNSLPLVRGTWFVEVGENNYQLLDGVNAKLTRQIEEKYLTEFVNQPLDPNLEEVQASASILRELKINDKVCVIYENILRSNAVILDNGTTSIIAPYAAMPSKTRLRRGYPTEARLDENERVVHVVFVAHGIGQKQFGSIVQSTNSTEALVGDLKRRHYPDTKGRVVFVPIDWRSKLPLDDDVIAGITINYMEAVRTLINETLIDVLFYVNSGYTQAIRNSLIDALNQSYRTYLVHDPGFYARDGKVSIFAHSLGSVISYDILSCRPVRVIGGSQSISKKPIGTSAPSVMPHLEFKVLHLICAGSPLGIFLATRKVSGESIMHLPGGAPGFRLCNVFYPSDLISYRIEPLVIKEYADVHPLRVHKVDAHDQPSYRTMKAEKLKKQRKTVSPISGGSTTKPEVKNVGEKASETPLPVTPLKLVKELAYRIEVELPYRIDFMLQPSQWSTYLAAGTSHNDYWTDPDVAMFLLSNFFGSPNITIIRSCVDVKSSASVDENEAASDNEEVRNGVELFCSDLVCVF